jgi:two-component system nitrate/nitrite response regulator NarL
MNKIKLIIADDHHLIRLGLKNVLASNADLEILHEFDNGLDALNYILDKEPDMAIIDIDMPGISGLELCKLVRENELSTKILFLTMLNQETVFNKARELGANGFLLKDFIIEELFMAIDTIFNDKFYFSDNLKLKLNNDFSKFVVDKTLIEKLSRLTETEKKILKLIATNLNSEQIAEKLFASINTVKTHRKNISHKLELENEQNNLLKFAVKNQIYLD